MAKSIQGNTLLYKIAIILKEHTSNIEPMSLDELREKIFAEEDEKGDKNKNKIKGYRTRSLQRAINSIIEDKKLQEIFSVCELNNFEGKRSKWQLYYDHKLTEDDMNIVLLALYYFNGVGDIKIGSVIDKIPSCGSGRTYEKDRLEDIMCTEDRVLQGELKKGEGVRQTNIVENIQFLYKMIVGVNAENEDGSDYEEVETNYHNDKSQEDAGKMISFNLYGFDRDGKRKDLGKTYKVFPLYVAASGGRFWLLAKNEKYSNLSIFPIDLMMNLAVISDSDILPIEIRNKYDGMKESYLREHMNLSYDEPKYAYLKCRRYREGTGSENNFPAYNRLYNTFGKDFEFIESISEKLGVDWDVIRVKRSPYGLINWVFSNCEYISFAFDEEIMTEQYMGEHVEDMRAIKSLVEERMEQMLSGAQG